MAPSTETLLPWAVLTASLMGSMHCVSMCGGLVAASARGRKEVLLYHFGRFVGYVGLGALAGLLGAHVLFSASRGWMGWLGSVVMALALISLGIGVWRKRPIHLTLLPRSWVQTLLSWSSGKPFYMGLVSAFLPCGWLHTFVLGAIATQSVWKGALFLAFFWAGTLPAMLAAPLMIIQIGKPLARLAPKATALILIAAGFGTLAMRSKIMLTPSHSGAPTQAHHEHCSE